MSEAARRSWLLAPMSKPDSIEQAVRSGADVVVLDLVELVAEEDKHSARSNVHAAIKTVRTGGAEAFVMIDPELMYADLHACVWPGLGGVIVSRAESGKQVADVAALLTQLEGERGVLPNALKIVAALETAPGNSAAYEIATASPRVWGVTLGRADLIMDLRPEPSGEIHLMPYLMQRLIIVAGAAKVTPIGAWWRSPDRGLLATPENTYQAAHRGRAIGFRGALCLRGNQVDSLNRAYA
jgi:citrate lyase subunit beta / citryl-CoA lyase